MKTSCCRPWASLLLPLLLAATACQRPEEPPQPEDLLPKAKVVAVLAQLHLLEARVENSRLTPDSARALYQAQHKQIMWKEEVSDSAFNRSYRYYGIHGKDLDEIYGAVIDSLSAVERKLTPVPTAPAPAAAAPVPPAR